MFPRRPVQYPLVERDNEILRFIYLWKVVTTKQVANWIFVSKEAGVLAYIRLNILRKRGLVQCIYTDHRTFSWILTEKGFKSIQRLLPPEANDSFKPESTEHDYWLSGIHLGHWTKLPIGVELFSEQELRSIPKDNYPDWVPKTDIHRPDGYWLIPGKPTPHLIALEVELSNKTDAEYEKAARFYSENRSISRVVWVVNPDTKAKNLFSKFEKFAPNDYKMNDFVLLSDLKTKGWLSKIVFGFEAGKPLAFLLEKELLPLCYQGSNLPLWDGRKKPRGISTCMTCAARTFCNCIAYSAIPNNNYPPAALASATNLSLDSYKNNSPLPNEVSK